MRIVIPGEPVAWARAGVYRSGKGLCFYDKQSQSKVGVSFVMEKALREALDSENKEIVMEASNLASAEFLHVTLEFTLPIPRSFNRSEVNRVLWSLPERISRPDLDNLVKYYLDAGNGILWRDDCLITRIVATKRYGKNPQTVIDIMPAKKKLSDPAKEILEELSPDEVLELSEGFSELTNFVVALQQVPGDTSSEMYCKHVNTIATAVSRLADKYSRSLTRIHKKHPGFWQNEPRA